MQENQGRILLMSREMWHICVDEISAFETCREIVQ